MKAILSKTFMILYFVLMLGFGVLFSTLVMKISGNDNDILLQIFMLIVGVVLNFAFSFFVIKKINDKIAKTSFMEDFLLFFFQLIITGAMFLLVWTTSWNFQPSSNDYNNNAASNSNYSCYVCGKKGASYTFGSYHYCYSCYTTAKAWHDAVY